MGISVVNFAMHQGKEAVCLLIFTPCRAASDYYGASVMGHAQDQHWVTHADLQLGLQISAKIHICIEDTWC